MSNRLGQKASGKICMMQTICTCKGLGSRRNVQKVFEPVAPALYHPPPLWSGPDEEPLVNQLQPRWRRPSELLQPAPQTLALQPPPPAAQSHQQQQQQRHHHHHQLLDNLEPSVTQIYFPIYPKTIRCWSKILTFLYAIFADQDLLVMSKADLFCARRDGFQVSREGARLPEGLATKGATIWPLICGRQGGRETLCENCEH